MPTTPGSAGLTAPYGKVVTVAPADTGVSGPRGVIGYVPESQGQDAVLTPHGDAVTVQANTAGMASKAQAPNSRTTADGTTTAGSSTVGSATMAWTNSDIFRYLTGTGIPAGSVIVAVASDGKSCTINTTATATGATITLVTKDQNGYPTDARMKDMGTALVQPINPNNS